MFIYCTALLNKFLPEMLKVFHLLAFMLLGIAVIVIADEHKGPNRIHLQSESKDRIIVVEKQKGLDVNN